MTYAIRYLTRALPTVIVLFLLGAFYQAFAQKCFKYDQKVTLTGRLFSRIFAGPPNWESIRNGDSKEKAWLVSLNRKICTTANSFDVAERGIAEVQLVIRSKKHWKIIRSRTSKQVKVVGTLFHGHSGYHIAKVLIDVGDIRAAK